MLQFAGMEWFRNKHDGLAETARVNLVAHDLGPGREAYHLDVDERHQRTVLNDHAIGIPDRVGETDFQQPLGHLNHIHDLADHQSMPSSRLEVATTHRSWPRLSRSSICLRLSFDTDP